MEREFENTKQWAVILGGSSGLGLATAKKLAEHGMNLCIVHRDLRSEMGLIREEFKWIEEQGVSLLSYNKDAGREDHLDWIIPRLREGMGEKGSVKLLVHSIARGHLKPMDSRKGEALRATDILMTLDSMAVSMYTWTRRLLQEKMFGARARIVGFTSEGNSRVLNSYGAVSVAKSALESLMRQMAVEMAPYGLNVNCIQAGMTDTRSLRMIPGSERLMAYALKRNPKGRLTRPSDVADAVYLLCREEADWINGTTLVVDGGEHLH